MFFFGGEKLYRYCNIGLLVFLLHDVTDVELEFTKLNVYFKRRGGKVYYSHEYISVIGFIVFAWTWWVDEDKLMVLIPPRKIFDLNILSSLAFEYLQY